MQTENVPPEPAPPPERSAHVVALAAKHGIDPDLALYADERAERKGWAPGWPLFVERRPDDWYAAWAATLAGIVIDRMRARSRVTAYDLLVASGVRVSCAVGNGWVTRHGGVYDPSARLFVAPVERVHTRAVRRAAVRAVVLALADDAGVSFRCDVARLADAATATVERRVGLPARATAYDRTGWDQHIAAAFAEAS